MSTSRPNGSDDQIPSAGGRVVRGVFFNQTGTTFTLATDEGFELWRCADESVRFVCRRAMGGSLNIVQQLFETNFFCLVGGGERPAFPENRCILWNDYKNTQTAQLTEKDAILGVRINNDVIAVVTRHVAQLYNLEATRPLCGPIHTFENPTGACALGCGGRSVFLCPGPRLGSVTVIDYATLAERVVQCHSHPVAHIVLNTAGAHPDADAGAADTMFATASTNGTIVRVFEVGTLSRIKEFRRGADSCTVHGLAFSDDYRAIACTSSKQTLHVWSLVDEFANVSSRARLFRPLAGYFGSQWAPFSIPVETTAAHHAVVTAVAAPGGSEAQSDMYRVRVIGQDGSVGTCTLRFRTGECQPAEPTSLSQLEQHAPSADPQA